MRKVRRKLNGIVSLAICTMVSLQISVPVFAKENLKPLSEQTNDQIVKKVKDIRHGELSDQEILDNIEKAKKSKGNLEDYKNLNAELGISDFWNSIEIKDVGNYFIHDDGSVTLRDATNMPDVQLKEDTQKVKDFEKKYKDYIKRLEDYNKKIGVNVKVHETDGNGNISVGSLENGGYSCTISRSKIAGNCVKGDVVTVDNPGVKEQGIINHAGIYDGTASWSDRCVLSADGPGQYVGWDDIKDYMTYDECVFWNVWPATKGMAASAFDNVMGVSWGDPYKWYSTKVDPWYWYCSKVPWWGYQYASVTLLDIDVDGGYWCLPQDIYYSPYTSRRSGCSFY